MYLLYEEYFGGLICETGETTNIIGLYSTKEKAIEKAKYMIEEDIRCNNYVIDTERNNIENEYVIMWYNNQENWDDYYMVIIEKLELDQEKN